MDNKIRIGSKMKQSHVMILLCVHLHFVYGCPDNKDFVRVSTLVNTDLWTRAKDVLSNQTFYMDKMTTLFAGCYRMCNSLVASCVAFAFSGGQCLLCDGRDDGDILSIRLLPLVYIWRSRIADRSASDSSPQYDASAPLTVDNGFYAGSWGHIDVCPRSYFASGVQLSVDDSTITDDWGVDAVKLFCTNEATLLTDATITSTALEWGEWAPAVSCSANFFITGFGMLSEPSQGAGDDSATNALRVECRGPGLWGEQEAVLQAPGVSEAGAQWGSWSESCSPGQAVNAIQVKYEDDQGFWSDDTAVGDVKLFCSDY